MWIGKGFKIFILYILFSCVFCKAHAARLAPERLYQEFWCTKLGGHTEVKLPDGARVDCLYNDYAIEFDFANKWAEAIGQSLYYGHSLNKKAGIVLIMENSPKEKRYLMRLMKIAKLHNITVWTITPDDLDLQHKL